MARHIFLLAFSLAFSSFTFAQQPQSLIKLQAGKNPEGIAVNPVTHKAYVVAEVDDPDRQVVMVFDEAALNGTSPPKLIQIPDETEYITVDSLRNRIYLSTRYGLDEGDGADTDAPLPAQGTAVTLGTLTVIDGNTDTVIATYQFPEGVEPEGVAVDVHRNIVYVGTKMPEPEPANGACPWGTFFMDRDGDEECWTAGTIYAFNAADITTGPIKLIPAGDDPESVVYADNKVYAANEDDGTITIARAVRADGSGGELITGTPAYSPALPPYSLGVFYSLGPNTLACPDKQYEADKMAVGPGGLVYITDDKSRVALISSDEVINLTTIPIDPVLGQCVVTPNSDENGLNMANNIAVMHTDAGSRVYVVSEQNTVEVLEPGSLARRGTITIPSAVHLDAIGIDSAAKRVWITDEALMTVFVLQGACADGTGACEETTPVAILTSPVPGSTLMSSIATFNWTAAPGATSYQIWVGTTVGAHDLGVFSTPGLSATFSNLPVNGIPLHVKLCTLLGSAWQCNDYTYTAATIPVAILTSPVPGSTLSDSTATFSWDPAAAATSYQIWVGTAFGMHDLAVVSTTGLSATIYNLPMNGIPLYVKLCTLTGGVWRCSDAEYTTATVPIATITSPTPGSTLAGTTATFSWTAAAGATSYQLWIGTTSGAHDLGVVSTTDLSATIYNLPMSGVPLYVRLCTLTGATWHCNDYTFTAATIAIATITSPIPGSTLTGSTATFNWAAAEGATSYQIWVGTSLGAHDLGVFSTGGLSATFSNLPMNGVPLYVRLYTQTGGTWRWSDATYTAATIAVATITSPAPGSTLTGSAVTFSWAAAEGATSYQIWAGTTSGAHDLGVVSTASSSAMFSDLPITGVPLYVKLCTLTGGAWYCNDYTYTTGP